MGKMLVHKAACSAVNMCNEEAPKEELASASSCSTYLFLSDTINDLCVCVCVRMCSGASARSSTRGLIMSLRVALRRALATLLASSTLIGGLVKFILSLSLIAPGLPSKDRQTLLQRTWPMLPQLFKRKRSHWWAFFDKIASSAAFTSLIVILSYIKDMAELCQQTVIDLSVSEFSSVLVMESIQSKFTRAGPLNTSEGSWRHLRFLTHGTSTRWFHKHVVVQILITLSKH